MAKRFQKALWWVKRDFRLIDNEAYRLALENSEDVLPFFCYEPLLLNGPDWGPFHTSCMSQAQVSFRKNLRAFGSDLFVSTHDVIETLESLKAQHDFSAIYAHEETGLNHTFERDKRVAGWCAKHGVAFVEVKNNGVIRRLKSRDTWEHDFNAFITAPQSHVPRQLSLGESAKKLASRTEDPTRESLGIADLPDALPIVSEAEARKTVQDFLSNRSRGYSGGISAMNKAVLHSSRLSAHLAWGTLSLRHVFQETEAARMDAAEISNDYFYQRSLKSFKSRLYWHAHFVQKLEGEIGMEFAPQNRAFENALPYVEGDETLERLQAWEKGSTGFPMIDASMRYFGRYGWLNFRSRAMVASFAMHALRLDWRVIMYKMAPFMSDYVPGIHVAQIQMQAGLTGGNAIRIYSPMKQMQDHDPEAIFIKENVPELQAFGPESIAAFESVIHAGYPRPIIDFKAETKIMKDALYAIKKSPFGKAEADRVYQKHGSRAKSIWR